MLRILTTNLAIAGLPVAEALLAAPGSPCSPDCGNVLDSTSTADIVCDQGYYSSSSTYNDGAGPVFEGCVQCELASSYASSTNYTDAMAMLYNLRYTVSSCVFNYPDNPEFIDTPCLTSKACGPFMDAITYQNLSTQYDGFEFCDSWPVNDTADFQGCTQCLQAGGNYYLANFVTVLQAGCVQQPIPGVTVAIQGSIFANDIVNVSTPTPTAQIDPAWFDQGPLTLGGKVGIAVVGLVLLLIIAGVAVVWNGKRRRRAFLKTLEATYAANANGGNRGGWPSSGPSNREMEMGETPISQRPLRGWNDSPMTVNTEKTFPQYFSPYSSQYSSPISSDALHQMPWPDAAAAAMASARQIGLSLGGGSDHDHDHDRWPASPEDKGKMRDESYEMHEVDSAGSGNNNSSSSSSNRRAATVHAEAPILSHPGYGRSSDSPPRQYDATEHDSKNGNGVY